MAETTRRRKIQEAYNKKHGITPASIQKKIADSRLAGKAKDVAPELEEIDVNILDARELKMYVGELTDQMELAAQDLQFELAAKLRDRIEEVNKIRKLKK